MKRKNGTTYKEIYSDTLEGPYFGSMERMQEEEQHEIVFSILHSHGRQQEILDYAELIVLLLVLSLIFKNKGQAEPGRDLPFGQ